MSLNNGTMFQFFHWYNPSDGTLWKEVEDKSSELSAAGITAIWLPPAYKGQGGIYDVGYGVYDLFDLGEYEQKNTVRTKYGTKVELLSAITAIQENKMEVYGDVVLNHKDGGDFTENIWVQEVDWHDRNKILSDWYQIDAWTHFTFPGRGEEHSKMKWHWWCFDSLAYNATTNSADKLYRLKEKGFEKEVSTENSK